MKVTEVPSQVGPGGLAEIVRLTVRFGFTTIVIGAEVAGLPAAQAALLVTMQRTWSPVTSVDDTKVLEVTPGMGFPFRVHWYRGFDPPFTGKAVKVTGVPWQIAPGGFAETETLTGRTGLTIMVIVLEVAGLFSVHGISEVSSHFTWSPFKGE